eukprot:jgi/Mesvir1/16512/Mv25191-RA.2
MGQALGCVQAEGTRSTPELLYHRYEEVSAQCKSKGLSLLEVSISCHDLTTMDLLSQTDPLAVMEELNPGWWEELGRTEARIDDDNPTFMGKVYLPLQPDRQNTIMRVRLFNMQRAPQGMDVYRVDLSRQGFLGEVRFFTRDFLGGGSSKPWVLTRQIVNELDPRLALKSGTVTVRAHVVPFVSAYVNLLVHLEKPPREPVLRAPHPYLVFSRIEANGTLVPVFQASIKPKGKEEQKLL